MLALRLLQETTSSADISWLIWVVLALFLLMVLLGWWASGRLPKEDETVSVHEVGSAEAAGHGDDPHEAHAAADAEGAAGNHEGQPGAH